MTPRLWRLRQLIVSDLNTSTQTILVLCFCACFSCFEFCFHFWWWDFSHPWPFPQFWPVFDLPPIIHPWQANSTDDIAAVKTILNERCIFQEKFTFQLHGILQKLSRNLGVKYTPTTKWLYTYYVCSRLFLTKISQACWLIPVCTRTYSWS